MGVIRTLLDARSKFVYLKQQNMRHKEIKNRRTEKLKK